MHSDAQPIHPSDLLLAQIFEAQREAMLARRVNFGLAARLAMLEKLRAQIKRHEAEIIAALHSDFSKPASEVILTEILPVLHEISLVRRNLKRWMRPRWVRPSLSVFGTTARIRPEPKGVCLIIAPWNYPFCLALRPLVSAIAAGNSAIVKPSEMTPATAALLARLVADTFPSDLATVVEGDVSVAQALLELPFDHVFFTGSPMAGRAVMGAAARTLASVTLELGGKSPVVIGPGANIKKAARYVSWGKFANCGQTCIAPDHVYVHRSVLAPFKAALNAEISRVYGETFAEQLASPDYARIVNTRHFDRLSSLIGDAVTKGAQLLRGGETDRDSRFIAPTLIEQTSAEMEISRQELFGPILPIIVYDDIEEPITQINAGPKPLALYLFDRSTEFADTIVSRTSSGAVGVNLTMLQYMHPNLPFGGVNNSGIGATNGIYGFRAFSHEKPVLRDRFSLTPLLFAPYSWGVRRLIRGVVRLLG
jgi:aldehyde dehydrogenase (NAD+)